MTLRMQFGFECVKCYTQAIAHPKELIYAYIVHLSSYHKRKENNKMYTLLKFVVIICIVLIYGSLKHIFYLYTVY